MAGMFTQVFNLSALKRFSETKELSDVTIVFTTNMDGVRDALQSHMSAAASTEEPPKKKLKVQSISQNQRNH